MPCTTLTSRPNRTKKSIVLLLKVVFRLQIGHLVQQGRWDSNPHRADFRHRQEVYQRSEKRTNGPNPRARSSYMITVGRAGIVTNRRPKARTFVRLRCAS
jgi:hypothetical protein